MADIVNAVICYDNAEENIQYAKDFFALDGSDTAALIITVNKLDNYEIDKMKDEMRTISKNIYIYNPGKNLGYMNGMMYGYSSYVKEHTKPHYVIMSNTDISFPDALILEKIRAKKYSDEIWCIGPSVYVPSRETYDNPVSVERISRKHVERLVRIFQTPIIGSMYVYGASIKGKMIKQQELPSTNVYQVHGCWFIIRSELADEMLLKPFRALLYSEESYVAEMVYHQNKTEYYDRDLRIHHNEHSVTGKLKCKRIAKHSAESMKVILQDFYE